MSVTDRCTGLILIAIIVSPIFIIVSSPVESIDYTYHDNHNTSIPSQFSDDPTPLSKVTLVSPDPTSYLDEFSYMAAVPTSVFYHNGNQILSPLMYSSWDDSMDYLLADWREYLEPDGGVFQVVAIGDYSASEISSLQKTLGSKVYPQISGETSAEVAAKIAVNDWSSSDIVVLSLAQDSFSVPATITGSALHAFSSPSVAPLSETNTFSGVGPFEITFTPPVGAGWIEGFADWPSSSGVVMTHTLYDPNGNPVDYSVYSRVVHERGTTYGPIPLNFWLPVTAQGEYTLRLTPSIPVSGSLEVECEITYHPGFTQNIDVPGNAKWLNVSASWDNAGTIVNPALIDPSGRMVQWDPAESLLSGAGKKKIAIPYPIQGSWTFTASWMNPEAEDNNVDVEWSISTLPSNIDGYFESAANGAVLASLLNVPLLYVNSNNIPEATEWAISRLGSSIGILVDPQDIHAPGLEGELSSLVALSNISTYQGLTNMIQTASHSKDVILTIPRGNNDELFSVAALSGAFHGAPVFSMTGENNLLTTYAEETWAPYKIGPEIEVFITNQYTTRTENGWYDERIPNMYSMMNSFNAFHDFLVARGAYNDSITQSVVILSPTDLIKVSFDRSIIGSFNTGRIPAEKSSMASFMVNKAILHRFLYLIAENHNDALLTMYAYTHGTPITDSFFNTRTLYQMTDTSTPLDGYGFDIVRHVGENEVFASLASQVGFWTMSTHGTLTMYPTDPPQRPEGPGIFSLRSLDAAYGFENESTVDYNGDGIVNPVQFQAENRIHVLKTTDDLEAEIQNLGSPLVILTACLLGGSRLPTMLMEHGAVAVTAAPRTVYFRPAGMLSVLLVESLVAGNTTGQSLNYGLRALSYVYTLPGGTNVNDYANQQIVFGDPSIKLYVESSHPRIASIDPSETDFGTHTPNRGFPAVVGLGTTDYLSSIYDTLGIDYDYYSTNNISEMFESLDLRRLLVVEPDTIDNIAGSLADYLMFLDDYVDTGGCIVLLGMNSDISSLPWGFEFLTTSPSGPITIVDTTHPLLTSPNTLALTGSLSGSFAQVGANISVLAESEGNPVFIARVKGSGKIAATTVIPDETEEENLIQNVISWYDAPMLRIDNIQKNQEIIWAGDRVIITLELTDLIGNGVSGASVQVWINETEIIVTESGSGFYTLVLDEMWTSSHEGILDIRVNAQKDGYDTLDLVLSDFLYIRPSPWIAIAIVGVIVGIAFTGWAYRKRKRGEPLYERKKKKRFQDYRRLSKEERKRKEKEEEAKRKRRKEEDERIDVGEFFGVE